MEIRAHHRRARLPGGVDVLAEAGDDRDDQGHAARPRRVRARDRPGRRHAGACLRAGAGLRRRLRAACAPSRPASSSGRRRPRRRRRPTSAPSTCRSSTPAPRTTPGGARASPSGPPSPAAQPNFAGHVQPSCRRISASTTCACPRRWREQWRLAEARGHRRLLRLPLLVRRPAAAGGAARRPARAPGGAVPLLPLLGQRGLAAQLGRALRRHPDDAELRRGLRGRPRRQRRCRISPIRATPGPTAGGRAS